MNRSLLKIPWFVAAPAVVGAAAVLAVAANLLIGPYFERSFLDEADPLAAAGGPPVPDATATQESGDATSTPDAALSPTQPSSNEPVVLFQGQWRDGEPGHHGKGTVRIGRGADGKLILRVEEFSVTNGPDLFVVLSPKDDGYAGGSLNLGGLKATDGSFNYEIPDGTDLSQYKSVVVWCRGADVTFAYATLEPAP